MALDSLNQQRLQKLERLQSLGINAYPPRFERSHTTRQAIELIESAADAASLPEVTVAGRIMAERSMGKMAFMDIRDGAGKIQLFIRRDSIGEEKYALLKEFDIGDIIGAKGKPFRTRSGEPSIEVREFSMLTKSIQPLPEKWHGLTDVEIRYRKRYVDLISNPEVKDIFIARSKIISAIREFLDGRGFIEVETPVLQGEAGAAARPFITHYNALDHDFYLRIALELYLKRLIVGGFDKVYELGRIFRNEGIDFKHNPEFTMLETYEAYADYQSVMTMVEAMISGVCQRVHGTMKIEYNGSTIDFTPPWKRIDMRQAIIEYAGIDFQQFPDTESLKAEMQRKGVQFDPSKGRGKLIDELVSTFIDPKLIQPTIIYDYPIEMSPLAKKKPGTDNIVERFEAYAGGMEIANAFTELNDPLDQRARLVKQAEERHAGDEEAQDVDEDFLLALEHGMPPTGGLGVGIDRLVMLLTNQQSIREVIFFPQLKEKG